MVLIAHHHHSHSFRNNCPCLDYIFYYTGFSIGYFWILDFVTIIYDRQVKLHFVKIFVLFNIKDHQIISCKCCFTFLMLVYNYHLQMHFFYNFCINYFIDLSKNLIIYKNFFSMAKYFNKLWVDWTINYFFIWDNQNLGLIRCHHNDHNFYRISTC